VGKSLTSSDPPGRARRTCSMNAVSCARATRSGPGVQSGSLTNRCSRRRRIELGVLGVEP
jgi:hypothetical protein